MTCWLQLAHQDGNSNALSCAGLLQNVLPNFISTKCHCMASSTTLALRALKMTNQLMVLMYDTAQLSSGAVLSILQCYLVNMPYACPVPCCVNHTGLWCLQTVAV